MKILIVGASGVLGRAALPHLLRHEVMGTTRTPAKLPALAALGVRPEVCDVYESGALERIARAFAPEIVVNFLTDLAAGPGPANSRIRIEGGPIVVAAARAAGAARLVVESVAFAPPSQAAVTALEDGALASGLDAVVLRFGRFWGPGTWSERAPEAPAIHVTEAGARAAQLIIDGSPGIHVVAEPGPGLDA